MNLERLMSLPGWLSLMFPVPRSLVFTVGLVAALGLAMFLVVRLRRSRAARAPGMKVERPPETVTARARELMDDSEVALLNLLLLAARDHFLVLAKIPLMRLMRLQVWDDFDAQVVAKGIRKMTVDFVLLHPGTRRAVKAIFVEKPGDNALSWHVRQPWLDMLFRDAEIEVIRLDWDVRYNVEQLTELLGIKDE